MRKWTAFTIGIIMAFIFVITMFVIPQLLGWTLPTISSWQDVLDSISTAEGLTIGIVSQLIPIICATIGGIYFIIFAIKLIRGKE